MPARVIYSILPGRYGNEAMIDRLRAIYQREMMTPSPLAIFINPFFLLRRALLVHLRKTLSGIKGRRVLDVGCGSKPYEALFDVEDYVGTDIEKSGHDHASSRVDVFYDGKTLPAENGSVDIVFSSEVFEHVFGLDDLLDEIHRVLQDDGMLVFTAPFIWGEHEQPYDYARYTQFAWADLLDRHGFDLVERVKTTGDIETIFQLLASYIHQGVLPNNRLVRLVLTPFLIAPVSLIGFLLARILPDTGTLYANNIIVARKT